VSLNSCQVAGVDGRFGSRRRSVRYQFTSSTVSKSIKDILMCFCGKIRTVITIGLIHFVERHSAVASEALAVSNCLTYMISNSSLQTCNLVSSDGEREIVMMPFC